MKTVGVTVGKFMPPHKGHELMIDFGSNLLGEMHVICAGNHDDFIDVNTRFGWLTQHYKSWDNVTIHKMYDNIPMGDIDEHGTVTDPEFWIKWCKAFNRYVPNATHFVSSDLYGLKAAQELGIKWLPVDPDRETVPISGTMIRKDPMKHINYMMDEAKVNYVKKVVIVGPESTGKSTLVKDLAKLHNTVGVHEYGRTVSTLLDHEIGTQDFFDILDGQQALVRCSLWNANKVLFVDTEAYTTYLYAKTYLGEEMEEIAVEAYEEEFDLYVLLAPSIPWVNDGTRVVPSLSDRQKFYNDMLDFLVDNGKKYIIINETDHIVRQNLITNALHARKIL